MADQVVPITDIASTGVIIDTPSISLPPNAYSDVQNVRFHAGAVRKMEGEDDLSLPNLPDGVIKYATYWKAPSRDYYIVIAEDTDTNKVNIGVYDIDEIDADYSPASQMNTFARGGNWQHTLFNGGFNIVFNNGQDVPEYLSDPAGEDNMTALPNWDSYLAQEEVTSVVWDEFNADISLGRGVDFTTENLLYSVIPRDTSIGIINYTLTTGDPIPAEAPFSLIVTDADNLMVTPDPRTDEQIGALPGDQVIISIQTRASIQVRAGVIRAYGNLLIAGDLTEMDADDNDMIVRTLPGTIRTSDVAAPGAVPLNWNPFRNGANTADEFILSSTGRVQDMAELQGVMYVYTDVSIHGIQQTGNEVIPFQISTVTDSYGANSLGAVMEFDGRHLVVGSQDIYVFAGHPGSIASIADQRVRHYAYSPSGGIDEIDVTDVRMVRNQKYDEIWLFSPNGSIEEMLVWNYRSQAWTIREQTAVNSGTQGKDGPLFTSNTRVFLGDAPDVYTKADDTMYVSYVQRMRLGLTPEFDTETLGATAIMYTSSVENELLRPNLEILMRGSETPSDTDGLPMGDRKSFIFHGMGDYKVDTRIHGRFINYKISDGLTNDMGTLAPNTSEPWNITGYQLEIMKGGKR